MKKLCLVALMCGMVVSGATASDYRYSETETVTTWESVNYNSGCGCGCEKRFGSSRDVVKPVTRPCARYAGQPVRVKTHTEVIDHYQVYQPVTVYKPMGTEIQRRIIR